MKLKNIHLFLILLIVLILSHFGLVIREGATGDDVDREIYIDCKPVGEPKNDPPRTPPPPLENPVDQAAIAVLIAIITGVIIRKLM